MKVSYNWLKEYLDLTNLSHEELYNLITFHIGEIEEYKKMVEASNLMIGLVKEKVAHPDSDHLNICQVELSDGIRQIVCGASNVDVNQKVIVALPGAVLPGNFKIKEAKVRGVESKGMICSLQELGIEEKYIKEEFRNGIFVLDDDAVIGDDPLKYLGFDDYIIDLELTANRSDLLSIEGVCFDLGAVLRQKFDKVKPIVKEVDELNPIEVTIASDNCKMYFTRYLKNVTIKESPNWLKARLMASGIRPINNVVDITNYVLMELGQPLHAFDADLLGNKIVVRNALENEKLLTLDSIERNLDVSDIVITDGSQPLCLGGVMGGASTEVNDNTKNVVLEAAYFDPLTVRKTSSRLDLRSESSTRFERKIDPKRILRALDRAAELMQNLCDAEVLSGVNGIDNLGFVEKNVTITLNKVNKVLGTNITKVELEDIFDALAYEYTLNNDVYTIQIPSRRMDLEASNQDIIEDVARIYGYNNIPTVIAATSDKGALTEKQSTLRHIRQYFMNNGFNETITYSLVSEAELGLFTNDISDPIKLLMPLSEDRSVMRRSLLNGLVKVVAYNKARKLDDLALFEIGSKYRLDKEELLLSGVMTGCYNSSLWQGNKGKVDFYLLKGKLDALFSMLGYEASYNALKDMPNFHPGMTAEIIVSNKVIGIIGKLHPSFEKENDLNDTFVFEVNLSILFNIAKKEFKYEPIPKFPTVTRDLAIVVKKDVNASQVVDIVKMVSKKYLVELDIFDVYEGEKVGSDEKSLALKLVFQDREKTLETETVDKVINSILNRLDFNLKAYIRK